MNATNRISSGGSRSQKPNKPSKLLTAEENEQVFALLGSKRQTQCTAVVQLFSTDPPAHSHWIKRYTGALCFVKDSAKRSYFMRLYCLNRNAMVWEQEVYEPFTVNRPRPYLLTFDGDDRIICFNFADESEAEQFKNTIFNLISSRMKKKEEKKNRQRPGRPPNVPGAVDTTALNNNNEDVVLRKQPTNNMNVTKTVPNTVTTNTGTATPNFGFIQSNKDKEHRKGPKKKLTKQDISYPTDFKHVTHVGWNSHKGFEFNGEDEEAIKPFLLKAGVSEKQLEDRETKQFIYDFIQSYDVLKVVKQESQSETTSPPPEATAPPVPSRTPSQHITNVPPPPKTQNGTTTQKPAPPPPPQRQPRTAPEPSQPVSRPAPPQVNRVPVRPPPITNINVTSAVPAPPPPPPPPPVMPIPIVKEPESNTTSNNKPSPGASLPVVDNSRSALLDSIRKGVTLRKVDELSIHSTGSSGDDARSNLMAEIRHGTTLRPAKERELSDRMSEIKSDALADALKRALENRVRVFQPDSDSSESFDNDDDWND